MTRDEQAGARALAIILFAALVVFGVAAGFIIALVQHYHS